MKTTSSRPCSKICKGEKWIIQWSPWFQFGSMACFFFLVRKNVHQEFLVNFLDCSSRSKSSSTSRHFPSRWWSWKQCLNMAVSSGLLYPATFMSCRYQQRTDRLSSEQHFQSEEWGHIDGEGSGWVKMSHTFIATVYDSVYLWKFHQDFHKLCRRYIAIAELPLSLAKYMLILPPLLLPFHSSGCWSCSCSNCCCWHRCETELLMLCKDS